MKYMYVCIHKNIQNTEIKSEKVCWIFMYFLYIIRIHYSSCIKCSSSTKPQKICDL